MATYYVYSGAAGGATGADWANAFTTLAGAFSGKAAGDIFYVADDHAESQASAMTLTPPGTAASPCFVYCVRRTGGSVPPVSADLRTTATITTTGDNAITFSMQFTYYYGITFSAGTSTAVNGIATTSTGVLLFKSCALRKLGTTESTVAIALGPLGSNSDSLVVLDNTTVQFGATGDRMVLRGRARWQNTASAITGATIPTALFGGLAVSSTTLVEGVDLSALGSGTTLVAASTAALEHVFKDCKLGSSVTVAATPAGPGRTETSLIRCDSGDTNYRTEKYSYMGVLTTETTIVRTGGASDGTTPIAWKVVTTANSAGITPSGTTSVSVKPM